MEPAYDPVAEVIRAGPLEIRPVESLVIAAGRVLTLSVREQALLVALARRAARIVSRDQLFELVWSGTMRPSDRSVDVYVHKLRIKLEEALPTGGSSTRTSGSATASPPSLHTLFTRVPQLGNRLGSQGWKPRPRHVSG